MKRSLAMPLASRSGQITVMFVAGLMTFLGMLALTVDVGHFYAAKAQFQAAADMAVLGAFAQVDPAAAYKQQVESVKQKIAQFERVNFNQTDGRALAETPSASGLGFLTVKTYQDPGTKRLGKVEASASPRLRTYFANLFGRSRVDIGIYAVVEGEPVMKDGQMFMDVRLVD